MCERCWGKAFIAAYGIGSKTQTGEYERIVASCKCTPWQRLGVANGFAEGYEARLAEDAKVREKLVEALEAARVRVQLSDEEINKLDGEVTMSHTWHTINAALAAAMVPPIPLPEPKGGE